MKKIFFTFLFLIFVVSANAATYYVDADCATPGTGTSDTCSNAADDPFQTIAAVNGVNFADGDIISFEKGDTFNDADLTLNAIADPTTKTVTITSHGAGNLPWIGGNTRKTLINNVGLSIVIQNVNMDGQESESYYKLILDDLKDITIDNLEMDGSVGYTTACTPDTDCAEVSAIHIVNSTGAVEIKNSTIENWGGDEDLWVIPSPAGIGVDRWGLAIDGKTAGTLSIHDNTITNVESDCIVLQNVTIAGTEIYDNTLWNGGENSLDIKYSSHVSAYNNVVGRDAAFVGVGGSSTGETNGEQGLIQVLAAASGSCDDINVYDNEFGPTDLANFRLRPSAGKTLTNVSFYQNYCLQARYHIVVSAVAAPSDGFEVYDNIFDGLAATNSGFVNAYDANNTTDTLYYNNTFYSGADVAVDVAYVYLTWSDAVFINNIFYINDADADEPIVLARSTGAPSFSYNTFYNFDDGDDEIICIGATADTYCTGGTSYDESEQAAWRAVPHTGALFDNPDFTDAAADEFWLLAESPCINAGVVLQSHPDGLVSTATWNPFSIVTTPQANHGASFEMGAYVYTTITYSPNRIIIISSVDIGCIPMM